jgi:serine protease Do
MKPSLFPKTVLTTGLLTSTLLTASFAIEPPEDDAPPAAVKNEETAIPLPEIQLQQDLIPPAKQNAPFLGVVSADVPDILAEHLNLPDREGVVVRSLVPDGPAAKAGITTNDVITRVSGTPVGSPQELSEKIAAQKPGDPLAIDLIHRGKPATVQVTLGVRPADLAASGEPADPLTFDLQGLPEELANRIRDLQNNGKANLEEGLEALRKRLEGAWEQGILPNPADKIQGEATVRIQDNDGQIELKSRDGGKEVTVRDNDGKIVWSGPWDTDQDKAAAPANVRSRIDSLNIDPNFQGGGLRFQLNRPAPEPRNEPPRDEP